MDLHETNPAILFLHDGELDDLREPLSTLGGGIVERNRGPNAEDRVRTWDLVLATSKRMLSLDGELFQPPGVRIAVLDCDSKTLRAMLRRAGADLLVRRPVHPAALRLLILHSLYRGPEKRRTNRLSIGAAIRFRSGLRRRNAILAELSPTGCRILAPNASDHVKTGARLVLQLPDELCGGRGFTIAGRVLRIEDEASGTNAIAIHFGTLRRSVVDRLRCVLAAHSDGPAVLERGAAGTLALAGPPTDVTDPDTDPGTEPSPMCSERRRQPRHNLERRVIALGEQASRVLMGRDLSAGGMRVAPAPGLHVGLQLKIALHAGDVNQPLVLEAEVARDDADAGFGLRFMNLAPEHQDRITEMLQALPEISAFDDSVDSNGVFVSEVLSRRTG